MAVQCDRKFPVKFLDEPLAEEKYRINSGHFLWEWQILSRLDNDRCDDDEIAESHSLSCNCMNKTDRIRSKKIRYDETIMSTNRFLEINTLENILMKIFEIWCTKSGTRQFEFSCYWEKLEEWLF